MKTIYLDVLLCLNLYINYFVLRATAKLLHAKLRTGRCLLAAGVGSLFSLTILLPPMPPVYSILFKLLATCIILMLAVGVRQKRLLLGGIFCFFWHQFWICRTAACHWFLLRWKICDLWKRILLFGFFPLAAYFIHPACIWCHAIGTALAQSFVSCDRSLSGLHSAGRKNGFAARITGYRQSAH